MTTNPSLAGTHHREEQILLEWHAQIGNSEKQLWGLIHSKGLLDSNAQELYRKVRSSYEKTILDSHTHPELQHVEYCLWKLHYRYIDEFRRRIKKFSYNAENDKLGIPQGGVSEMSNDNYIKAFKSFLSEASEFYQTLMVKLRNCYGVSEVALFYKRDWASTSFDSETILKCQNLCHRFLVCMGDLERYKQQYANLEIQNKDWSVASRHYVEATRIGPDSGNPQNQLAVLATYIGDDFLAVPYCVRSLAVKEPFPDAWDNLIFLLEKNRSCNLQYVSTKVSFDSARSDQETKLQPNDESSHYSKLEGENNHFKDTNLEEFQAALTSTIAVLDTMMELEDTELKAMLELQEQMDSARKGPFRALQLVSILIFSIKNLTENHERNEPKYKRDCQQLMLIQLALTAAFNFMGRFVERCLKATSLNSCPLLPSIIVFLEWCARKLDAITEVYAADQNSIHAISYFSGVLVELLNQLNDNREEIKQLPNSTPLWEDYELRGFLPVSCSHLSLDFSGCLEHIDNFESGMELRTKRMIEAAMKIVSRSSPNLQKWMIFDALGRKFYVARPDRDHKKKETENVVASDDRSATGELEPNQKTHINTEGNGKCIAGDDNPSSYSSNDKSVDVEEEEVILFRPVTRYNSAPSYSHPSISLYEKVPPKDKDDQGLTPEDCLHCPAPMLMSQNPSQSDPRGFHGDTANKSFRQKEASMKERSNAHTISAGPPSLSSWVLDRNMGTNGGSEQRLQPIDERASSYLDALSISKTENSVHESLYFPPTSASIPSPPLLPKNPPTISGQEYWSSASTYVTPGFVSGFQVHSNGFQQSERNSSSEWLPRYRENHTHEHFNNHMVQPTHLNVLGNHENSFHHDTYRLNNFNQYGQCGNPIPYHYTYMEPPLQPVFSYTFGAAEHSTSNLFNNFQRPSPYGCSGAVTEQLRNEPQILLEYLKEKEWRLQRDPTYMGN